MLRRIWTPRLGPSAQTALADVLSHPRYEVLPLPGTTDKLVDNVSPEVTVTVTASPRQGMTGTVQLATDLASRGWHAVPHLSARLIADEGQLKSIMDDLTSAGIGEVFVIGGDPDKPAGDFTSSLELLQSMNRLGHDFTVGIAGHPEHHPKIDDDLTVEAMWDKRGYASYIVTQLCFDAKPLLEWVERVRRRGVVLPIYVGVAGPASKSQLLETGSRIGVGKSLRTLGHEGAGLLHLARPGKWHPGGLIKVLAKEFADSTDELTGLHVNTFNRIKSAERWRQKEMQKLDGSLR